MQTGRKRREGRGAHPRLRYETRTGLSNKSWTALFYSYCSSGIFPNTQFLGGLKNASDSPVLVSFVPAGPCCRSCAHRLRDMFRTNPARLRFLFGLHRPFPVRSSSRAVPAAPSVSSCRADFPILFCAGSHCIRIVHPSCSRPVSFCFVRNEEECATAETHAGPHPVADGLRPGRQQRTADNDGIEGNHPLRRPAPFSHLHCPFALPHHGCASTRPHPSPGLLFHLLRRAVRSCPRSVPHLRAQCTRFFFILDSRTGAVHFHPIPENRTRFPISDTASAVRSDGFSGPAFCTRTPVSSSRSSVPACIRANHAANGLTKTRCRRAESRRSSTNSRTGRVPERLRYSTTYEIVMSQELQTGRQCGRFAERRTAASVPVKTAKLRMAEQKRKKACGMTGPRSDNGQQAHRSRKASCPTNLR